MGGVKREGSGGGLHGTASVDATTCDCLRSYHAAVLLLGLTVSFPATALLAPLARWERASPSVGVVLGLALARRGSFVWFHRNAQVP